MNKKLQEKGITLVALVVTIIILLILAGVTIGAITSNTGLLSRTQQAKAKYENASADETNALQDATDLIDNYAGNKSSKLSIGDTVTYTPASATYNWQSAYSGNSSDATLDNTTSDYKVTEWKVFDIKQDGTVELISANPTTGTVYLGNAQGYNNAVKLLNDASNTLYGNSTKGITGRSIKIENIEDRMTDTALASVHSYADDAKYNTQVPSAYSSTYSNYPSIYVNERLSVINGTQKTEGLEFSEQTNFIGATNNGATAGKLSATSIQPYQTYWYKDNSFMQSAFKGEGTNTGNTNYNLIMPKGSNTTYWVASRCVRANSAYCDFYVRNVYSGYVHAYCMCNSYTDTYSGSLALRPVVSLSSKLLSGNDTDGWSIK